MAASTSDLYDRVWRFTVGTVQTDRLRCVAKVEKTLDNKPNTAEVQIYNLHREHLDNIAKAGEVPVKIEAGYGKTLSTLYLGTLRNATVIRDSGSPDVYVKLETGDGQTNVERSFVSKTIAPKSTPDSVLRELALALGVKPGNLDKAKAAIKTQVGGDLFPTGGVLWGSAADEMTRICRSVGLLWTIHNGVLQFTPIDKALEGTALKIDGQHGMVKTPPSIDNKGVLTFSTLLIPDLYPGRKIVMNAAYVKGQWRVEKCSYDLDTHGEAWFIDCTAKRY